MLRSLYTNNRYRRLHVHFHYIAPLDVTLVSRSSLRQVRNLCIIYLSCAVAAMVIVSLLLDPIKLDQETSEEDRKLSHKLLVATVKHLVSSPSQILLVPLTMYSGIEQAFIAGEFTQAFISCCLGVKNVGYIMICYGVTDSACCILFGKLVQYAGHTTFFGLGESPFFLLSGLGESPFISFCGFGKSPFLSLFMSR
ncbi:hypothetical protein V1264_001148 [Littorina saxatilis]|uniref:Uncharacterized protein n=1 Tax=Littorina saxatilis TaxID=31220 RepID=A0AAN9GQJ9_9CAEN